jgi:hypothetical protein
MKMFPKKKFQKINNHPRVGTPVERTRINFGSPFEVSSPTTTHGSSTSLDYYDEEDLEILKRIQEIKEEIKILDEREIEYLEISHDMRFNIHILKLQLDILKKN